MNNKVKTLIVIAIVVLAVLVANPIFSQKNDLVEPIFITFNGIHDETCYAAPFCYDTEGKYIDFIGKMESAGKLENGFAYNYIKECDDPDVFEAFENYTDFSQLSFMYAIYNITDGDTICLPYDTPEIFKVVLYYPESKAFAITRVAQKFAYQSHFSAKYDEQNDIFQLERKFIFAKDVIMILLQVIISLAATISIAYSFYYRNKKELKVITFANAITLLVLNLLGYSIKFFMGTESLIQSYVALMFVAFVIHSIIYIRRITTPDEALDKERPILFAFASNAENFGICVILSVFIFG